MNDQHAKISSPRKILIVEDDSSLREAFRDILEWHGFEVATAGNGQEALDYLSQNDAPDLILLDLMMPVMSGKELLDRVHQDERFNDIPIVVLSAIADLVSPNLHGYPAVTKPVGLETLINLVNQYCGNSSRIERKVHKSK